MRFLRRLPRRERGQTLVEFAILAPVFFLLFFGIAEAGMLFHAWVTVQDAAERGARYAITGRDTCTSGGIGRGGCISSEALTAFAHINDRANATVSIRSWDFPTYTVVYNNNPGGPCDAVEVSVRYAYTPRIPLVGTALGVGNINLTGRQRFISEPFGACSATS
jgi:Flp pilus assembly protein TadG